MANINFPISNIRFTSIEGKSFCSNDNIVCVLEDCWCKTCSLKSAFDNSWIQGVVSGGFEFLSYILEQSFPPISRHPPPSARKKIKTVLKLPLLISVCTLEIILILLSTLIQIPPCCCVMAVIGYTLSSRTIYNEIKINFIFKNWSCEIWQQKCNFCIILYYFQT